MKNLQITAYLASPMAVLDDWSPMLDGLLQWLWLDQENLAASSPQPDTLIEAPIPLRQDAIKEQKFWACSSPFYQIESEQIIRYRKRWDYQDRYCAWGKRKAKVNSGEGNTKSYDIPLRLVVTDRVDWFAVGDPEPISRLLANCTNIGKKRSQGKGQVSSWNVKEFSCDWSLYRNGRLTRPFPAHLMPSIEGYDLFFWGWKPPVWLPQNQIMCCMPINISRNITHG